MRFDLLLKSVRFIAPILITFILILSLIMALSSCSAVRQIGSGVFATADYFRVETLPSGEETAPYGLTRGRGIEHTYAASHNQVWIAAQRAALKLVAQSYIEGSGIKAKTRQNPKFDPATGTIKIGEINEIVKTEVFASRTWKDEITIKLAPSDSGRMSVTVVRTAIVPSGDALHPAVEDKVSSGNYERWILTQIEDDLAGKIRRETIAVVPLRSVSAPKLQFDYSHAAPAKNPEFTLGTLTPSFFIASTPINDSPFISNLLKNVGSESAANFEHCIKGYRKVLETDIERVLASRRFRTSGPLPSMEQMTYPQREASLLVLASKTVLDIRETYDQTSVTAPAVTKGSIQDSLQPGITRGKLTVSGRVELELYEPFSREKMWTKTVTIASDQREFVYRWTIRQEEYYGGQMDLTDVVNGEDMRPNILAEMLSKSFSKTLDEIARLFDPKELKPIYDMAKELRAKRKY